MSIKALFTSRFEGGYIIEADWRQIEVVGAAIISQDPQLMDDLRNGRDLHCQAVAWTTDRDYDEVYAAYKAGDEATAKLRKGRKYCTFSLFYGAEAASIAAKTGLPKKVVQSFMKKFYARYHVLGSFHEEIAVAVRRSKVPTGELIDGHPQHQGQYIMPTGRRLVFTEERAPKYVSTPTTFSPTKMKNYFSQSFAGGDIVPMVHGELLRMLMDSPVLRDYCLMINHIHDSVIFDCHPDALDVACRTIKYTMEDMPFYLSMYFGIETDLDFPVDVEVGHVWTEMKPWTG